MRFSITHAFYLQLEALLLKICYCLLTDGFRLPIVIGALACILMKIYDRGAEHSPLRCFSVSIVLAALSSVVVCFACTYSPYVMIEEDFASMVSLEYTVFEPLLARWAACVYLLELAASSGVLLAAWLTMFLVLARRDDLCKLKSLSTSTKSQTVSA